MSHGRLACTLALACSFAFPAAALAKGPLPVPEAVRDTEPVVLKGTQLGDWAVPANQTAKLPLTDLACYSYTPTVPSDPSEGGADSLTDGFDGSKCPHSDYAKPEVDTAPLQPSGTPVNLLVGYRWDAKHERYKQIPFQVDEAFTRYLDNSASGFALYSGQDQHTTYAYDREGFRFTKDGPASDPCRAQAASPAMKDPIAGLDTNDELAFMASDAGPQAPSDAAKPKGVEAMREVAVTDP